MDCLENRSRVSWIDAGHFETTCKVVDMHLSIEHMKILSKSHRLICSPGFCFIIMSHDFGKAFFIGPDTDLSKGWSQ